MFAIDDIYNNILKATNILVIGDIICDNYLYGNVTRLSPEAPVPIIKPCNEIFKLGGAANVFNNIISLGANAHLCGIIGNDKEGNNIRTKLDELNNVSDFIIIDNKKTTTRKTRVLVNNHHLLRIDEEDITEIDEMIEAKMFNAIKDRIDFYKLLIISDYNKGFLKYSFVRKVIDLFLSRNIKIIVDPKSDFYKYSGAFLIVSVKLQTVFTKPYTPPVRTRSRAKGCPNHRRISCSIAFLKETSHNKTGAIRLL